MKKILTMFVATLFAFQFTGLSCYAKSTTVKNNTSITVASKEAHSSKTLSTGEKIECIILEDVIVNNQTVFKKGGRATLNVVNSKKAKFAGIPGEITVAGGEVFDTNNQGHMVTINQVITGEEKIWPKVCLCCGIFIILAPLALFGFVKGGQAEISPVQTKQVFLNQDFVFKKD